MSEKAVKQLIVSGAVILRVNNGVKEIFATQRGYGEFKDGWEFPGGKVEAGETLQEALNEKNIMMIEINNKKLTELLDEIENGKNDHFIA